MNDTALSTPTKQTQVINQETEFEKIAKSYLPPNHPKLIENQILKEEEQRKQGVQVIPSQSPDQYPYFHKAASMSEFNTGILLHELVPDAYRPLAIKLMMDYQEEFEANTTSEKSLCELAALSYIRVLETTRKLKDNMSTVQTRYDINYIGILSKEVDRANRHYLSAIQELRNSKRPQMSITVKTNHAVVGNQQIVGMDNPSHRYE